jgi:hypothetical protein
MAYPCARHSFSYRHQGIGGLAEDDEDVDNDSDEARSSVGGACGSDESLTGASIVEESTISIAAAPGVFSVIVSLMSFIIE